MTRIRFKGFPRYDVAGVSARLTGAPLGTDANVGPPGRLSTRCHISARDRLVGAGVKRGANRRAEAGRMSTGGASVPPTWPVGGERGVVAQPGAAASAIAWCGLIGGDGVRRPRRGWRHRRRRRGRTGRRGRRLPGAASQPITSITTMSVAVTAFTTPESLKARKASLPALDGPIAEVVVRIGVEVVQVGDAAVRREITRAWFRRTTAPRPPST